ncbi:ribose ABC transporter permease [Sphaerisporangium sp. NPDC088356]|uniref:ABC transporter permease subunit n=1 Tax=Sphaerisporangium sp. NPDC088356 TaxID=3154871 RepID=UPI0034142C95
MTSRSPRNGYRFREVIERNATFLGPLVALILLVALFGTLAPSTFLSSGNITNVLSQVSVLAIMAAGLTFVLLLGQIDLSVASVAILSGIVSAALFSGQPLTLPIVGAIQAPGQQWLAILLALVVSVVMGLLSGQLTARYGIPSFIVTLGVLEMAQGLAFYWSGGKNIYKIAPISSTLGNSFLGPLPVIVLVAAVTLLIGHFVLTWTRFGRYVYMVGANPKAAELSGIAVRRITITVFVIASALSGLAGLVAVGRLGSAQASSGDDLLLPAIAAVVLGGTSLFGGIGSMKHTVIGLLLYGVLNNGLDQLDISIYLKPFARGAFLLLAIAFNIAAIRVASRARSRASTLSEQSTPAAPPPSQPVPVAVGHPTIPAPDPASAPVVSGREGEQ